MEFRTLRRHGRALAAATALSAALAAVGAAPAAAADPNPASMAYDLVVLRPLGLVQTVVGAGFFAVFYPISLATGGSDHVLEFCILSPVQQTFTRRLGAL